MTENNNVDGVTVEAAQEPLSVSKKRGGRVKGTVSNLDSAPSATKPAQNSLDDDGVTVETAQEISDVQPDEATPTAATPTGNEKEPKAKRAEIFKFSVYLEQARYDDFKLLSEHSKFKSLSELTAELVRKYIDANRARLDYYRNDNAPTENI